MAIAIGAILAALSIAILAYPLFKSRLGSEAQSKGSTLPTGPIATPGELDSVYELIRALQLDYQLGKVPESLYQEQFNGYRVQAAAILRQQAQDQAGKAGWTLEQEIAQARAALKHGIDTSDANGAGLGALCIQCGAPQPGKTERCAECGGEPGNPELGNPELGNQ